jgi:hypothetical protein
MKFEALPYYRFFWRDYRASINVQQMNYVERGLYRELLDECWAHGFIPNDLQSVAKICKCPKRVLERAWPKLSMCFTPISPDQPSVLINPRMNAERTAVDDVRLTKQMAGAKGGLARVANQASAKHPLYNISNKQNISEVILSRESSTFDENARAQDSKHLPKQMLDDGCMQAAKWAASELHISGKAVWVLLDTIRSELKSSTDSPQIIAEALVRRRRAYEAAPHKNFVYNRKAFFEYGIYRDQGEASDRETIPAADSYADPGVPCAQCGNYAGQRDPNDPNAIYVCSQQCKEAYESKATSSKTEAGS